MKSKLFKTLLCAIWMAGCLQVGAHPILFRDTKDQERMLVYILENYKRVYGENFSLENKKDGAFALEGDESNCIMDCATSFPKKTVFRVTVSGDEAKFLVAGDYVKNHHPYGKDLLDTIKMSGNPDAYITVYGTKALCDSHLTGGRRIERCRLFFDLKNAEDVSLLTRVQSKVN